MQAFAALLDALSYQPARNAKLRLIETYLRETPDPDRGWALAALTGEPEEARCIGVEPDDRQLVAHEASQSSPG